MNIKKSLSLLLAAFMAVSLLTSCSGRVVSVGESASGTETPESGGNTEVPDGTTPVKTGLSIVTDLSGSTGAAPDADGIAQADITLVAVTVDDAGVIDQCVIDMVQAKIRFGADGVLLTDPSTEFPGKNELGRDYGMHQASSIGKDWSEQAAALADYVKGKTLDEVTGIAVDESGKAISADLTASVTISIGDFLGGIQDAVTKAAHLGAQKGDTLKLEVITTMSGSTSASADAPGAAQVSASIAAVTLGDGTITSCHVDAVQAAVSFDAVGQITSDLAAHVPSKNELGRDYGMHQASSIGRDWSEQAAAFSQYVTGKTLAEAAGIAVNESSKAADADLAASVTIAIGDFLALLAKAAQ